MPYGKRMTTEEKSQMNITHPCADISVKSMLYYFVVEV